MQWGQFGMRASPYALPNIDHSCTGRNSAIQELQTTGRIEILREQRCKIHYSTSNRIGVKINFFNNTPVSSQTVHCRLRKSQYSLWNINDDACLLLAIIHSGEKGISGESSLQMSPDFFPQD